MDAFLLFLFAFNLALALLNVFAGNLGYALFNAFAAFFMLITSIRVSEK